MSYPDAHCEACGHQGPELHWLEEESISCRKPACRVKLLRPMARELLSQHAPSIACSDALDCIDIDIDILASLGDGFAPETISARGLAIAAARFWRDVIEGEIDELDWGSR